MVATDFVKKCINIDPLSYQQCEELADNAATSLSGAIRIAIREAYAKMKQKEQRVAGTDVEK
jgi:hypothetical protein